MPTTKKDIIHQLQQEILQLQGFTPPSETDIRVDLGPVAAAFPNKVFPTGTIHEFIHETEESSAATGGFVSGILCSLLKKGAACIWISNSAVPFPAAMTGFGIDPGKIIFARFQRDRDVLWAMEEALKCEGLGAVVAEIQDINFAASRRLQLAVEHSLVTGLLLRNQPRDLNAIATAARWKITSLPSQLDEGMPGVGYPRWQVTLLRVRNGKTGAWQLEWSDDRFIPVVSHGERQQTDDMRKIG